MSVYAPLNREYEDTPHEINSPLTGSETLEAKMANDIYDRHDGFLLPGAHSKRHWMLRHLAAILNIVLSIACVGLLVYVFVLSRRNYDIFAHVPPYSNEVIYTPGIAPPLLGPEFQKRTVVFQRNESFMYEKEKAYPAWHEILHRARHGRVAFDSRPGEFFGIGGYHELHCVWLLQQAVDMAVNGPAMTDELQIDHMYHCAEFLRQSVMCHADNTIERRFEGILGPFSANNTHVCGNWHGLMDWADEHIYTGPYLNPHTKLPPK